VKHNTVALRHTRKRPGCRRQRLLRSSPMQSSTTRTTAVYVTGSGKTPIEASDHVARVAESYLAHETEHEPSHAVEEVTH